MKLIFKITTIVLLSAFLVWTQLKQQREINEMENKVYIMSRMLDQSTMELHECSEQVHEFSNVNDMLRIRYRMLKEQVQP